MLGKTVFLVAVMMASLANAQDTEPAETEPPAPWRHLDGRNTGTVGTCSPDDTGDITICYLVRCDKGELVFVMQEADIAEFGISKMTFEIGRYKRTIKMPPVRNDEHAISLAKEPKLLAALTSGADWASLSTSGARVEYSTGFELTNAPKLISELRAKCLK